MNSRAAERSTEAVMAILLDYYFLYLITLLSLRVFDGGQAGTDLDRLNALLAALQGQDGSGQQFVENSETLITLSTSQFGPDEDAYLRLLDRVRSLDHVHRTRVALTNSGILASHLRFGFEATYGRDLQKMREDNVPDYPWLCVSLLTLLQEYERLRSTGATDLERRPIVEGILNGLTPDCGALLTDPPAPLATCEADRAELCGLMERHRAALLTDFEGHRPSEQGYSPLCLFFNFPHNVLKGMVIDALFRGEPTKLSVNDMLRGAAQGDTSGDERLAMTETLMGFARTSPDRIRGRLVPAIIYDPQAGRRAYLRALDQIGRPG
jgi:hypothetical protein